MLENGFILSNMLEKGKDKFPTVGRSKVQGVNNRTVANTPIKMLGTGWIYA
jgi:hypothetical protein